ncbi:2-dehydro-3-deoxygluconokinase [Sedimentitalea sp. CY04]|uniref:2-dehydro-3-deoxygluconokinase n=1 Tax=Parasedimentitalea denitrificans TaxID=2211118 RepID=A0ABX0W3C6_9RHOB|nr:sugar kinase [Sedimentitalea sp. CY04]NIZ60007.1 2-dehydro-3-deoxygluconokinase [Sedimentitalea sp. CY04]
MSDLLCLGEPLYELNSLPDGTFKPGFGGDVSNVAIAAARQDASVGLISRVGDDPFGAQLCGLWQQEGVGTDNVAVMPEQETGLYFVFHDDDGHHFVYRRKGSAASRITADDVPETAISQTQMLYSSGIGLGVSTSLRAATFHAVAIAKQNGVPVAFDPNLRTVLWSLEQARTVTHDLMGQCDIALPGLDDARQLTGLHSPQDIIAFYHGLGARIVALTLGADGVAVSSNGRILTIPGTPVDAKDATGAGDCFNGIFLANYLRDSDIAMAAETANRGAALSTMGYGAVDPIPFKSTLDKSKDYQK